MSTVKFTEITTVKDAICYTKKASAVYVRSFLTTEDDYLVKAVKKDVLWNLSNLRHAETAVQGDYNEYTKELTLG